MPLIKRQPRHYTVINTLPAPMIGLVRMHCYRQGVFTLVDIPVAQAKKKQKELTQEGFVITYSETV